jgi:Protein of unknown function VcgC/VcgE (DUF2780)
MADFLSDLASKAGMDTDQAHQGLGALLAVLKSKMSPEAFEHLKNAIPSSENMLTSAQDKIQTGGAGLVESVKNMAGKIFGGGDQNPLGALESHFSNAGVSADQLKSLLPKLHEMLANKLPPNVLAQIEQHLPGFCPAEEEAVGKTS